MTPSEGTDRFWATLGSGPVIMGILNVTPDSFYDGGQHATVGAAVARGREMVAEGAVIVDVGGESTRPGHTPVDVGCEIDRVVPVIDELSRDDTLISIDTTKAAVARAALDAGAHVVNDIWGLQGDRDLADVVADHGAGVVVMHNRVSVAADLDILRDMHEFFTRSLGIADAAGIDRRRIMLDPGIGFGKTPAQNLTAIGHVGTLRQFGSPVLVGLSRKSFIGRALDDLDADRLPGTIAANLRAVQCGADVIRVHDVAAHAQALRIWSATGA